MPDVRVARPEVWTRVQMLDGKVVFHPPRVLFGPDIATTIKLKRAIYPDDLVDGRFLTAKDRGAKNCVISRKIADEHKKHVGSKLRIDGHDCTIIGIYDTGSMLFDMAIIMPMDDVRTISRLDDRTVSAVYVEPNSTANADQLIETISQMFRGRHGVTGMINPFLASRPEGVSLTDVAHSVLNGLASPPAKTSDPTTDDLQEDAVEVRSAQSWGARLLELNSDLDIFLWLMTLIGVVIALLSILNTMLMSVSERMTEFGVLRANGWTAGNILQLIMLESTSLGVCGGILGCIIGWIGTLVINALYEPAVNLYASPSILIFSLAFSMVLGLLGGLYPAWWAVRMSPMDAIRRA